MAKMLLLVDFEAGVAGLEDTILSGIGYGIHTRFFSEPPKPGDFEEVRQKGYHTNAAVGPLYVVDALFRMRLDRSYIGHTLKFGGVEFLIRPCPASLIATRLWERCTLPKIRAERREEHVTLQQARRMCFSHRNDPRPKEVCFAKGTTAVRPPAEAVARIGGSESSTVVFVDKFARPIWACRSEGSWRRWYPVSAPIPVAIDWRRLRSLGEATRLIYK